MQVTAQHGVASGAMDLKVCPQQRASDAECVAVVAAHPSKCAGQERAPDPEVLERVQQMTRGADMPVKRKTSHPLPAVIRDVQTCVALCMGHEWCTAFAHNDRQLQCTLFERLRYAHCSPEAHGYVSGILQPLASLPATCTQQAQSAPAANAAHGPRRVYSVASRTSCCLLCSLEPDPDVAWTYDSDTGECRCSLPAAFEYTTPRNVRYFIEHGVWYMGNWGPYPGFVMLLFFVVLRK